MFFYTENLVALTLLSGAEPWVFKLTETITPQIRGSKEDRQAWYNTSSTRHQFYSGVEPLNVSLRPSQQNPPLRLHAVSADYDILIPPARIEEAIASMKIKPAWVERSLGGNVRLVWIFSRPLMVETYDFCVFVLQQLKVWLQLGLLPGLDEAAFVTPSRLLCNGCDWKTTGHPAIPEPALQSFFVGCGRKFRFSSADVVEIPLDIAEKEIRARYSGFSWPGEFAIESQGPTFWIPESASPMSAIVKPNGLFTFSAHAAKPFYSWGDIIGPEFVKQFADNAIAKATNEVWWDSKRFWRRINGAYVSMGKDELLNFFKVDCRLSAKNSSEGVSQLDVALSHIHNHNRIVAAVPFVFRRTGVTLFMDERKLNTYTGKAVTPADGKHEWGASGEFPWMSTLFDNLFDPPIQLPHFLAWFKHYYIAAMEYTPLPGQNIFLMGGVGIGKTFTNREIVGVAVGGYVDASDFLVDGGQFNSHLIRTPHWCLDDDTPSHNPAAQFRMHAMFKKTSANQQFLCNQKFEVAGMTEWMGRIGCTTNLDYVSSRVVGPLDNSSLDKTNLFRCYAVSRIKFPKRRDLRQIVQKELPFFLRWLVDWTPPEQVEPDPRYGYKAFQEPTLLDQTHQGSPVAPFKELLIEALTEWFNDDTAHTEWKGTVSQLLRLVMADPRNDYMMRSLRLESVNRYLEQIQREGIITCGVETGPQKTRIWKFLRPPQADSADVLEPEVLFAGNNDDFSK